MVCRWGIPPCFARKRPPLPIIIEQRGPNMQGEKKKLLLGQVLTDIHSHSQDNDQALHQVGVAGVDAHELQGNLQHFEHADTDQNAGHGAHAAGGGTPPMVEAAMASSS